MDHGFPYLMAVLDIASHNVFVWWLSSMRTPDFCLAALEVVLAHYGTPEIFGYIRISQRAKRMNLRDSQPMCAPPVAQSSVETGFPRGSTGAHCARPAAWRPWHAVRGAVGRPRPVDYGENRIGNPFDHAAAALVGQENHVLGPGNSYWQSRIEPDFWFVRRICR